MTNETRQLTLAEIAGSVGAIAPFVYAKCSGEGVRPPRAA